MTEHSNAGTRLRRPLPPPNKMGRPPLTPPPTWGVDPMGDMMPQEDFHAVVSITLGELMRWNFIVWGEPSWTWDFWDEKQYWRVSEKIENHYWEREIGVLPPGSWKREFMRKMNEIMPKYKLLYRAIDDGVDSLIRVGTDYGKARNVGSNFPATQIRETSDYASDASDSQYENQHDGNFLDQAEKLKQYEDVDLQIVNELDSMFSSLLTVNINSGFGL